MKHLFQLIYLTGIFSAFLTLYPGLATAQNIKDGDVVIASPESWNFMKYGGDKPGLYTGTVNVGIPIYTYKDNDFELPVSLVYASNGYMPNVLSGMTGIGWHLECGGMITREVRGIPDEKSTLMSNHAHQLKGYDYLAKDPDRHEVVKNAFVEITPVSMDNFHDFSYDIPYYSANPREFYETASDIYTFRFPGYSGRFIFDIDGKATVIESNVPKGEITIETDKSDTRCPIFKILTGDGYEYTFGNGYKMDYEQSAYEFMANDEGDADYPVNYLISAIKAPDGREVQFTYGQAYPIQSPSIPVGRYVASENGEFVIPGWTSAGPVTFVNTLEKIEIGEFNISFTYSRREIEHYDTMLSSYPRLKLDSISFCYSPSGQDSKTIKTCTMEYAYGKSGGNPELMLKKVNLSGEGAYIMSYYGEDTPFPYLGHYGIDHWGYWNSLDSTNNPNEIIPENAGVNAYIWPIQDDNRAPDSEYSERGMLRKIVYPTQGWTEFEYEPHRYSRLVTREAPSYKIELKDVPEGEAGGVRIRKITDFASEDSYTTREYVYETEDGKSSGTLLHIPLYNISYKALRPHDGTEIFEEFTFAQRSITDLTQYSTDRSHIGYSRVEEKVSGGGTTAYAFTDFESYPDMDAGDTGLSYYIEVTENAFVDKLMDLRLSQDSRRGRLLRMSMYRDSAIVSDERYEYISTDSVEATVLQVAMNSSYVYDILCDYSLYPEKKIATAFLEGGTVTDTTVFGYNNAGQKIYERTSDGNGRYYIERTIYLSDKKASEYNADEAGMADTKQFALPLSHSSKISDLTDEYYLFDDRYLYNKFSNSGKYLYEKTDKAQYETSELVTTTADSDYETEIEVLERDGLGNPVLVEERGGKKTAYIWGYGGLYPIARIENLTSLSLLTSISGLENAPEVPLGGYFSPTQEESLLSIPETLSTLFEYSPFIGITKITDPSGKAIYYEYDDDGKLVSVKDDKGKLVESYQYNFKKEE